MATLIFAFSLWDRPLGVKQGALRSHAKVYDTWPELIGLI